MDRPITGQKSRVTRAAIVTGGVIALLVAVSVPLAIRYRQSHGSEATYTVEHSSRAITILGRAQLIPTSVSIISAPSVGVMLKQRVALGDHVVPDTVLVELSNPSVVEKVESAHRQKDLQAADNISLDADLADQLLAREGEVLAAKNAQSVAAAEYKAYFALQTRGAISSLALAKVRLQSEQATSQLSFAQRRMEQMRRQAGAKRQAGQTKLMLAEQEVMQAEARVKELDVKALTTGVVTKLSLSPGQSATAGQPIAEVIGEDLRADIEIAQADADRVQPGMLVALNAPQGQTTAIVMRVLPRASDGNVHVVATMPHRPAWAHPDISCEAEIHSSAAASGLFVHAPAGARANAGAMVIRLGPHGTERVFVRFGDRYGADLKVEGGLQSGDRIMASLPDTAQESAN